MSIIQDLFFSINTVLPVFIVILLGYYIRKKGTVDDDFIGVISNIVFYYALPARLFLDVASSNLMDLLNIRFIILIIGGTIVIFFAAWFVMRHSFDDTTVISVATHSAFRGNYIYIGMPISQNILQVDYIPCSVLVLTFIMPVYNILGVLIMSWYQDGLDSVDFKKIILNILKNPMIISVIAGVIYCASGLPMPYAIDRSFSYIGSIATPLALLMIGARMVDNSMRSNGRALSLILLFKLIIGPVMMTGLAIFLHLPVDEIVTIFVLFSVPSAMNVFIMTRSMGGDDRIAANAIVASVVGSVVTMTVGIYFLRLLQIV